MKVGGRVEITQRTWGSQPVATLNDASVMPLIGLGTYTMDDPGVIKKAVLELGYRHIDTASVYKN